MRGSLGELLGAGSVIAMIIRVGARIALVFTSGIVPVIICAHINLFMVID
jgi:hypothetical protein